MRPITSRTPPKLQQRIPRSSPDHEPRLVMPIINGDHLPRSAGALWSPAGRGPARTRSGTCPLDCLGPTTPTGHHGCALAAGKTYKERMVPSPGRRQALTDSHRPVQERPNTVADANAPARQVRNWLMDNGKAVSCSTCSTTRSSRPAHRSAGCSGRQEGRLGRSRPLPPTDSGTRGKQLAERGAKLHTIMKGAGPLSDLHGDVYAQITTARSYATQVHHGARAVIAGTAGAAPVKVGVLPARQVHC